MSQVQRPEASVNADYDGRSHWDDVANSIGHRGDSNVVAGDDTPFTRYLRTTFLEEFARIDFRGLRVLEVGPGPGGNLALVATRRPTELIGGDISERMIELARRNLADVQPPVHLFQMNGRDLPLRSGAVDMTYTVTVLQHVCDEETMAALLREICRVTTRRIVLFEDTFYRRWEKYSHVGRAVADYERLMGAAGFRLTQVQYLSTAFSHVTCSTIRRITSRRQRKEGEPVPALTSALQSTALALTRHLDRMWRVRAGLTKMVFERQQYDNGPHGPVVK